MIQSLDIVDISPVRQFPFYKATIILLNGQRIDTDDINVMNFYLKMINDYMKL